MTILPAACAGSIDPSRHSFACAAVKPAAGMDAESTSGTEATAGGITPMPVYELPLPSVTVLELPRSCVLAATVISHGPLCATLDSPMVSPELPAEAETKMPPAAALKTAMSSGSRFAVGLDGPTE